MNTYQSLLQRKGFAFFLTTQFLGAFNDNFYKMLVSLLVVNQAATGGFLSITAIVFIIPSLCFAGYAGFLADRFSKRTMLIITKSCEIIAMICAFFALGSQSTALMLAVLFVMATQSTFFSPAKYGIVPEMVSQEELSRANGLLQMTTYVAIIFGGVVGGALLALWGDQMHYIGFALIAVALLGTACSFGISRVQAASTRTLKVNPWGEIISGVRQFFNQPLLFWVVLAVSYFWALGLAMQLNIVALGHFSLGWGPLAIALMQAVLGIGIGVGSLIAGRVSGDKIEPGLIPLGAVLMGVFLLLLAQPDLSGPSIYIFLTLAGMSAGFYIVPLYALLQDLPHNNQKGRMIATANFMNAIAMLVAASLTWVFYTQLTLSPRQLMIAFGAFTLILACVTIRTLPDFFVRFLTFIITHSIYRVRIVGHPNVPRTGPALLVCNHVSYVDGMILSTSIPRFLRYMVYKDFYEHPMLKWMFKLAHAIPIKEGDYDLVLAALEQARDELRKGHVVCIFAEGSITRTGHMLPFRKGFERIMKDLDNVPIVPVHIGELWESIFAYRGGKVIWKMPRQFPIRVTLSFGDPMPSDSKANDVRQVVQELGAAAKIHSKNHKNILSLRVLKKRRRRFFSLCMVDRQDQPLSYGDFLAKALWLSRRFKKYYADQDRIAVLLPPGVPAALINVALTFAGKTCMNLPYGEVKADWRYFIDEADVKTIITSRSFLADIRAQVLPEMVYFEDWSHTLQPACSWLTQWYCFIMPSRWVLKRYGVLQHNADAPVNVCFSRGTQTSVKGVLLSHQNILANVYSFSQILHLTEKDRVMGVLPFYTAHGYSLTLWLPLIDGMGVVYDNKAHEDVDTFGRLVSQYKASMIFDTFKGYQAYLNDLRPKRFSYVRYPIVISHSLPDVFMRDFETQFGVDLLESYGCVEMGPGIALNVPDIRKPGRFQRGSKSGSVGHPLPGVAVKIVDVHTGKPLEIGQEGLLLVKGLGVMQGYLGGANTQASFREGWYITGDLAVLDADGFLFLKGRA